MGVVQSLEFCGCRGALDVNDWEAPNCVLNRHASGLQNFGKF